MARCTAEVSQCLSLQRLTLTEQVSCILTLILVQGLWGCLYPPVPELQQGQVGPAIELHHFKVDQDFPYLVLKLEITLTNYKQK